MQNYKKNFLIQKKVVNLLFKKNMKKLLFINVFITIFFNCIFAQDTIKVMSYNLLNFGNYTGYCNVSNNNDTVKTEYLRTIIEDQKPDILAVCELHPDKKYTINILGKVLNKNGLKWSRRNPTNFSHSDLVNCLFFDSTKFSCDAGMAIKTVYRDINIYKLKHLKSGTNFHVIIAHLKAGNTSTDANSRAAMTDSLMKYLKIYPDNTNNFMIVGDFNVYNANEVAFQNLINPTNTEIAFYDPINQIGNWHNNSAYKKYFTQSTSTDNGNNCKAPGGFDDRFDFILISSSIKNGTKNMKYQNDSYEAVGQDGNRFNQSLINPINNTRQSEVIDALSNMSDHLPIVAKFIFDGTSNITSQSINSQFVVTFENQITDKIDYQIKIDYPQKLDVALYSIDGRKVNETTIFAEQNGRYSINTTNLKSGIYILSFNGENVFQSYRINVFK